MSAIDRMPSEVRELVHEYGYHVVNTLIQQGIKDPRKIRHIVETILDEFLPTRGASSKQGIRSDLSSGYLKADF